MLSEYITDESGGRYDDIVAFAHIHPKGDGFTQCIDRLEDIVKNRPGAQCVVYNDYAPMSLYFNIKDAKGELIINGGIIYHGTHDGFGSGAAPTFSVTLEPTDGWGLHT